MALGCITLVFLRAEMDSLKLFLDTHLSLVLPELAQCVLSLSTSFKPSTL